MMISIPPLTSHMKSIFVKKNFKESIPMILFKGKVISKAVKVGWKQKNENRLQLKFKGRYGMCMVC